MQFSPYPKCVINAANQKRTPLLLPVAPKCQSRTQPQTMNGPGCESTKLGRTSHDMWRDHTPTDAVCERRPTYTQWWGGMRWMAALPSSPTCAVWVVSVILHKVDPSVLPSFPSKSPLTSRCCPVRNLPGSDASSLTQTGMCRQAGVGI